MWGLTWGEFWGGVATLFAGGGVVALVAVARQVPSVGSYIVRMIRPDASPVGLFMPSKEGYNKDFYEYFRSCIRNARRAIYITGDGFECRGDDGKGLAREFASDLRAALLKKDLHVVRVETRANGHPDWAAELASLKETFPERFSIYVYGDSSGSQLSSLCVIDPESSNECVVEIMLSTTRQFGIRAADLADTAIFITGRQELAISTRNRILSLTELDHVQEARDREDVMRLISGSVLYFSYGSNMSSEQ